WLDFCGITCTDKATGQIRLDRVRFNQTLGSADVSYQMQFNRILSHLSATDNLAEARRLVTLVMALYPQDSLPEQATLTAWGAAANLILTQRAQPTIDSLQAPQPQPIFRPIPTTTQPSVTTATTVTPTTPVTPRPRVTTGMTGIGAGAGIMGTGTGMTGSRAGTGTGTPRTQGTSGTAGAGRTPPPPVPPTVPVTGVPPAVRTSFDHIRVQLADVTAFQNGSIVNAANGQLAAGAGVCGAIFARAGSGSEQLAQQCRALIAALPQGSLTQNGHRGLPPGSAVVTTAPGPNYQAQNVRHIIHTVGPHLQNTNYYSMPTDANGRLITNPPPPQARLDLINAYRETFRLALVNGITNLALPVISGGLYLYDTMSSFREGITVASEPQFRSLNITFCFWNPADQTQAQQLHTQASQLLQRMKDAEVGQNQGAAAAP
ncbi:MAG: macro domain-containing protein, partial [Shewanella sp.]